MTCSGTNSSMLLPSSLIILHALSQSATGLWKYSIFQKKFVVNFVVAAWSRCVVNSIVLWLVSVVLRLFIFCYGLIALCCGLFPWVLRVYLLLLIWLCCAPVEVLLDKVMKFCVSQLHLVISILSKSYFSHKKKIAEESGFLH